MKTRCISVAKPEPGTINEDAVMARSTVIAVADGAGGGGIFAERWSRYLLDNLPIEPFVSLEEMDSWVDGIWELFYNESEMLAKAMGDGMILSKFYDEGSFSTLVAIWHINGNLRWVSYGDSVAFCYHKKSRALQYSIPHLACFNEAPYLINFKDTLRPGGFACGTFEEAVDSIYFVASDALAHYILMMYMVSRKDDYSHELAASLEAHSKNSQFVKTAMSMGKIDFWKTLSKLLRCLSNKANLNRHLARLRKNNLLAIDDCSLAVMRT